MKFKCSLVYAMENNGCAVYSLYRTGLKDSDICLPRWFTHFTGLLFSGYYTQGYYWRNGQGDGTAQNMPPHLHP